ncbi:MAG TPA: bifunctional shikimate kinase/3-dehydroquinate synthase [Streptosporangiaceae bacterium]
MIVLVGFMGAGKTTVGRLLADKLGLPFLDSDVVIEQRAGRTVREIFAEDGETAFRALEHKIVADLIEGPDVVLALGGGAPEHPATRALLSGGPSVVYLQVGYAQAMARVAGDEYRPMLHRPGLDDLYQRRLDVYGDVATLTIATDGRRPHAVANDVVEHLVRAPRVPAGTSTILVSCTGGTYNVHVGTGLLAQAGGLLPELPYTRTAVLITGLRHRSEADQVAQSLGRSRDLTVHLIEVPERQAAKDLAAVGSVSGQLAELAVHKDDLIVGVGGEVVCDIAGFVASTYNRGMPLALVPVTLAAQADSAVGGKASLNLPQGRNLLGTVHQPVAVLADVTTAQPGHDEYRAGLAEAVKHALISGGALVRVLAEHADVLRDKGDPDVLASVVTRSVQVKADIVGRDEREHGDRLHLNYGHTFGHAIEQLGAVDGFPGGTDDGEATSIGMMAAAYLARRQGRIGDDVVDLHRSLLSGLGLPVTASLDLDRLRKAWLRDKKYRDGIRFVVLNGLGRPEAGVLASGDDLSAALRDLAV